MTEWSSGIWRFSKAAQFWLRNRLGICPVTEFSWPLRPYIRFPFKGKTRDFSESPNGGNKQPHVYWSASWECDTSRIALGGREKGRVTRYSQPAMSVPTSLCDKQHQSGQHFTLGTLGLRVLHPVPALDINEHICSCYPLHIDKCSNYRAAISVEVIHGHAMRL